MLAGTKRVQHQLGLRSETDVSVAIGEHGESPWSLHGPIAAASRASLPTLIDFVFGFAADADVSVTGDGSASDESAAQ